MILSEEDIAKVCHEANRAYCQTTGDDSQTGWEDAPEWQRESAVSGVKFHLENPDASPEDSHRLWMKEKEEAGWVYGPIKAPDLKQHPCMVEYKDLPLRHQAKDHLFKAVVAALSVES